MAIKVSVVMPYWERRKALERTLETYAEHYGNDVQVIVVDDGSPNDPANGVQDTFPFVKVVTLERKERPLNPCVPINRGMIEATGDLLALSNPEVMHTAPVIGEMADMVTGSLDYVVCPAYCPEMSQWHAHPTLAKHPDMPIACGHFMAVFPRSLWWATDGFDEGYRYVQGYDDTDFIMRLLFVGADIKWHDGKVLHRKDGAVTNWNLPLGIKRFRERWPSAATQV